MKSSVVIFIFTFILVFHISAQNTDSSFTEKSKYNNALYYETLGNGLLFGSVNFERVILRSQFVHLTSRIGIGYLPSFFGRENYLTIPFELCSSIFSGNHKLEIGYGVTIMYELFEGIQPGFFGASYVEKGFTLISVPRLGYRYQYDNFLFRIAWTPIILLKEYTSNPYPMKNPTLPWFGISGGFLF